MKTYYYSEDPQIELSICHCSECMYAKKTGGKITEELLGSKYEEDEYQCEKLGIKVPSSFFCYHCDDNRYDDDEQPSS